MISKEYHATINVYKPRNYFEKWYADVWKRRNNKTTWPLSQLREILTDELALVGAEFEQSNQISGPKWTIKFYNDSNYTIFLLRWL